MGGGGGGVKKDEPVYIGTDNVKGKVQTTLYSCRWAQYEV